VGEGGGAYKGQTHISWGNLEKYNSVKNSFLHQLFLIYENKKERKLGGDFPLLPPSGAATCRTINILEDNRFIDIHAAVLMCTE
jgi:hypothetical protein